MVSIDGAVAGKIATQVHYLGDGEWLWRVVWDGQIVVLGGMAESRAACGEAAVGATVPWLMNQRIAVENPGWEAL